MPKPTFNEYPIDPILMSRWSPLAFSERAIEQETIQSLFEAVRWAPSCFNAQPWRFIVGTKNGDPETYAALLDCLVPANQVWASTAPLLMIGIASTLFEHNGAETRFALYDLGQAAAFFTVQAASLGVSVHQMGGFDMAKAQETFKIPHTYVIGAAIAAGYEGDPMQLSDQKYRDRHTNPARSRKALADIVLSNADGSFGTPSPLI